MLTDKIGTITYCGHFPIPFFSFLRGPLHSFSFVLRRLLIKCRSPFGASWSFLDSYWKGFHFFFFLRDVRAVCELHNVGLLLLHFDAGLCLLGYFCLAFGNVMTLFTTLETLLPLVRFSA